MNPGFHTASEYIEFEFVENKRSVFILKGGNIYPLTTFCGNGFILLQRAAGGGAVVLSAGDCGEGQVAEQPQAGKVGFD